ncbi:MAG: hypothetical protein V4690_03785 [Patescibacteria group bacterium]
MQIKTNTEIELVGRGSVILRPNDHIASGGEGSVYGLSDTVIKLYHDPQKVLGSGLQDKIKLLSGLQHPYIVAPKNLVFGSKGQFLGFYMEKADGHPLSQVFTNDFYLKYGFGDKDASVLVHRMREVFEFGHAHGATLVDPNELNWNVVHKKSKSPEPRVFDVDSWAIGKWKPTVIMPSIRDWHSKGFSQSTDWFSWGIITFQIYTGIHPYKGTLDGFKMGDLTGRMKANASVFSKGIRLNRAVRDFSVIPKNLLSWYESTFQKGERVKAPSPLDNNTVSPKTAKVLKTVTVGVGDLLVFQKLLTVANDPVVKVFSCGVALLSSGLLVEIFKNRKIGQVTSVEAEVVKVTGGYLVADYRNKVVVFEYIQETSFEKFELSFPYSLTRFLSYQNRMFAVTENGLTEVTVNMFAKPLLSAGNTWGVVVNSTKWWNGVGVQDMMGATYVISPFGEGTCAHVRVPELDNLKVVNAKSGHRFIVLSCVAKDGSYRKVELSFDSSYKTYKLSEKITDTAELNVAILPKGVCATIETDSELFITVPTNGTGKHLSDKNISTDMVLFNLGDMVVYIQNGDVWSLRMK